MESLKPTREELDLCMKDTGCIRNVCILAHVDHGKTTVADSLLATNRLVSKRMAGFLRYLDDRPDEQERGITMKSSAVSLLNLIYDEDRRANRRILLNLIDTPGHIDFSSEVGAALRVCDGAIILVDLVEGVCAQTRESIKQAFEEHTKMILILNKFDRLIVELGKDIDEIFQCILRVIEGCNAIVAELYQYELSDEEVDIEDTGLLFSPESGNVIFASATDGWGFTTKQIARMFVEKVSGETVESLNKKMWNFDCYLDSRKHTVVTGAIDKKKTNLFIQFCIKTIFQIYEMIVVRMERDKTQVILERLEIKNVTRDMTHNDPKVQVRSILQAWKPLATTILFQCMKIIPPPSKMDPRKTAYLLNINRYCEYPYLNDRIEEISNYFQNVSTDIDSPVIAYVSKMFCVNKKNLSQYKPKVFIPKPKDTSAESVKTLKSSEEPSEPKEEKEKSTEETIKGIDEDFAIIGLARVFSGTLTVGQEIYVISSSYLPDEGAIGDDTDKFVLHNKNIESVVIKELYMLFGRELMLVDSIPAGNFCGIGGIESVVTRTATLSTVPDCVPLNERICSDPVVRHAVEPINPKELPILRNGLRLLMQSDPCVRVVMQETGELVLLTAGDVHLGKCIEDLTSKFAKIQVNVSSPMVSLRETITNNLSENSEEFTVETPYFHISVITACLPEEIASTIKHNYELLRNIEEHQRKSLIDIIKEKTGKTWTAEKVFKSDLTKKGLIHVKEQLKKVFGNSGPLWNGLDEKIWSVSKTKGTENLLINDTMDYNQTIFVEIDGDPRMLFDHCIVNAFNMLCKAGPLCEEPLTNCSFIVKKLTLTGVVSENISAQSIALVESMVRALLKRALEKQEMRLMEPMYTTDIQVNTSILGKVYGVVSRRHGKVSDAVGMDEQEKTFLVRAQIPVAESDGFAGEIRKTTSGHANPSLRFSHYEIIDGDPLYVFAEDEDEEDENFNVEATLRAIRLRKDARKRKGLQVEDEVVIHAEKQRTKKK